MSKSTKLQELKMKIAEYNPDILELKFGCKIEVKWANGEKEIMTYIENKNILKDYYRETLRTDGCGCCACDFEKNDVKIIGRDINLEDILMALTKIKEEGCCNKSNKTYVCADVYAILEDWQLGKPLHEQDEPTINLLHNILC